AIHFLIKRATLNELITYITTIKGAIIESIYSEIIKMVSKNIFRSLPSITNDFDLPLKQEHKIVFLDEVEKILDIIELEQFKKIIRSFFKQLAKCISSPHFQIIFLSFRIIMEFIMFPALYRISKEHWNQTIVALIYNVLKIFMEMNEKFFDELTANYKFERQSENHISREKIKENER
ncbi:protein phosphatase 2A regulatory B subunit, partial [Onchocerca flexuosa]